jgi:hypothetical protein
MPNEEEPDCDPSKQATVENSLLAHAVCRSDLPWTQDESWFFQLLGVPLTQLVPLAREGRVCACGRHVIDEFGDHMHLCKKHTGSTKAAHETLLDALDALCFQAGIKTERRNIPSVTKPNGKIGRGDLVLKNVTLGGTATSSLTLRSFTRSGAITWPMSPATERCARWARLSSSRRPRAPRLVRAEVDKPLVKGSRQPEPSPSLPVTFRRALSACRMALSAPLRFL